MRGIFDDLFDLNHDGKLDFNEKILEFEELMRLTGESEKRSLLLRRLVVTNSMTWTDTAASKKQVSMTDLKKRTIAISDPVK